MSKITDCLSKTANYCNCSNAIKSVKNAPPVAIAGGVLGAIFAPVSAAYIYSESFKATIDNVIFKNSSDLFSKIYPAVRSAAASVRKNEFVKPILKNEIGNMATTYVLPAFAGAATVDGLDRLFLGTARKGNRCSKTIGALLESGTAGALAGVTYLVTNQNIHTAYSFAAGATLAMIWKAAHPKRHSPSLRIETTEKTDKKE